MDDKKKTFIAKQWITSIFAVLAACCYPMLSSESKPNQSNGPSFPERIKRFSQIFGETNYSLSLPMKGLKGHAGECAKDDDGYRCLFDGGNNTNKLITVYPERGRRQITVVELTYNSSPAIQCTSKPKVYAYGYNGESTKGYPPSMLQTNINGFKNEAYILKWVNKCMEEWDDSVTDFSIPNPHIKSIDITKAPAGSYDLNWDQLVRPKAMAIGNN
jgi:hypothetical protein